MAKSGAVRQYAGNLPAGIEFGDSRTEVEQKLGCKPVSSRLIQGRTSELPKDLWEDYRFEPFDLRFIFTDSPAKLSSMSIIL